MNQLITITENNGNKAVSARELHTFLENKDRFSKWFGRMRTYGFEEGVDYQGCELYHAQANQELTDYVLTLDTAKEISMLQKSDKGKQARRYFIEAEKKTKAIVPPTMLDKNQQHQTLLALLKTNLRKGDMKTIALDNGFTYDAVRNIFYASSRRPEVIKAIFDKAMANKKLQGNPQDMINQLIQ